MIVGSSGTEDKDRQLEMAQQPMEVTVGGSGTEVNYQQPENAPSAILPMAYCNVSEVDNMQA